MIAQGAIAFFMVPFLLGKMGTEGYGVVGIIMSIVGLSAIADLGLREALNRELSEMVVTDNREGFFRLSSSALVLYLVLSSLISFMGGFWAPELCSLFNVGAEYIELTIFLLRTYAPLAIILAFYYAGLYWWFSEFYAV